MSFIDTYRNVRETEKTDKEDLENYGKALDDYVAGYNKGKKKSETKTRADLEDAIKRLGVAEGSLTKDSSTGDIARYGIGILDDLNNDSEIDFGTYVNEKGTKEQREAWDSLNEAYSKANGYKPTKQKAPDNWFEAIGNGIASGAEGLGKGISAIFETPYWARVGANAGKWQRTVNAMQGDYEAYNKSLANNKYSFLDDPDKYIKAATSKEEGSGDKASDSGSDSGSTSSSNDTVEFTLTKANDPNYKGFGQKLVDLGLATDNGLWGENGDVAYYTKQLNNQGIYGNLPIGKKITLTRRK